MNTNDFDFELPEELIAQTPLEQRDASKLLVIDPVTKEMTPCIHRMVPEQRIWLYHHDFDRLRSEIRIWKEYFSKHFGRCG